MPWQRWFQRPKWWVYHDLTSKIEGKIWIYHDVTGKIEGEKNVGKNDPTRKAEKVQLVQQQNWWKLGRKIVINRKGSVCSSLSAQSAAGWSKLWTYTKFSDFPVFPFKFSPFPPPLTKIGPADYPSRKGNPSSTPPRGSSSCGSMLWLCWRPGVGSVQSSTSGFSKFLEVPNGLAQHRESVMEETNCWWHGRADLEDMTMFPQLVWFQLLISLPCHHEKNVQKPSSILHLFWANFKIPLINLPWNNLKNL